MFFISLISAYEEAEKKDRQKGSVDYSKMSQEELLSLVIQGDRAAFKVLYEKTDRSVYSFILSIMKNPQDAEELMQETYLKVWTSPHLYKDQGKALAWIFTIARNFCYMRLRGRKRESDIPVEELEQGELCPQIENAVDRLVLNKSLEVLSEQERQIVLLHTGAGLKHREIAASLNIPLATVLSKYSRSIKKLKASLSERSDADE